MAMTGLKDFFLRNLRSNLAFFEIEYPDIFERFKNYTEERYFLVFDADENFNIYDQVEAKNLYSEDPVRSISYQFYEYKKKPIYFSINYGESTELSSKVNPVHVSYTNKMSKIAVKQSLFVKKNESLPKKIKNMTVVSTGFSFDINYLVDDYDVGSLYVLEPCFDMFYVSLHTVNWKDIFHNAESKGTKINLFVADKERLASLYHKALFDNGRFNANSMYFYNGCYVDSVDEVMASVKQEISSVILMGFGFYDDSRLSLAASLSNIKNKIPCLTKKITGVSDLGDIPVFLIGAGPSIDNDVEFIAKNKSNAIIISCGSGIKVLERIGVSPDFHFECERTAFTQHWLEQVDGAFLKKAFYIGLNIIYPGVYDLFDKKGMVLKTFETGSALISQASVDVYNENIFPLFTNVNPTVMHMGAGLAPMLGFRKIYMFGADMGYKNPKNHHSEFSSYSDLKEEHKNSFEPGENQIFEVSPNFEGETVYTDRGFESFRIALEKILLQQSVFPGLEYFNCSDGSLIKGAKPVRSSEIESLSGLDKPGIISMIEGSFFSNVVGDEIYSAIVSRINNGSFNRFVEKSIEHFSKPVVSIDEADMLLQSYVQNFFHNKDLVPDEDSYILSVVSGSLLYYFTVLVRIIYFRADNVDDNVSYFNEACVELINFFSDLENDFLERYMVNDNIEYYNLF